MMRAGKIAQDQLPSALAQLADDDRRAEDAHSDFDAVTRLVKVEFARFESERVDEFKEMLGAYLDEQIERQREMIASWEAFHQLMARMQKTK